MEHMLVTNMTEKSLVDNIGKQLKASKNKNFYFAFNVRIDEFYTPIISYSNKWPFC